MKALMVKSSAYQRLRSHKNTRTDNISEFAAAARSRYNYLLKNDLLKTLSKSQLLAMTKSCYIDELIQSLLNEAKAEIAKQDSKSGFRASKLGIFWEAIHPSKKYEFDPSIFERISDEPLALLLLLNEFDGNCGDLRDEDLTSLPNKKVCSVTHADLDSIIENFCLGRSVPILGVAKDMFKFNKNSFDIDLEMPPIMFAACIKHAQLCGWQFTKTGWIEQFILEGKVPAAESLGELYVACDNLFDVIIASSLFVMGFDTFDVRTGLRIDLLSGFFGIFSFREAPDELNTVIAVPFVNNEGVNYKRIETRIPKFIRDVVPCTSERIDGEKVVEIAEAYFG